MSSPKALRCKAILFSLLLTSIGLIAGTRPSQQPVANGQLPSIEPQELVRRTVDNEIKAGNVDDIHYMFKDRRQTPDGSKTKMMIETTQGTVAYLIAVNDKPVTPEQRQQENQRLQNLLSNPDEQNRKKKEQQTDNDRVTKMFRQLPNAFNYQYDGTIPGSNGHTWVQLKFQPNPNYDPPSRESSVFKAMSGIMVIDPQVERLAKIEATLFRDVNFGWGILGHLDKGGHFFVQQTNVGDSRWEPTYMNIQFTGKALLFKTINLRQIESTSDYTRVPDNLTLAQGVDMLKKRADSVVAENDSAGR
jgi:hypothetical protein